MESSENVLIWTKKQNEILHKSPRFKWENIHGVANIFQAK